MQNWGQSIQLLVHSSFPVCLKGSGSVRMRAQDWLPGACHAHSWHSLGCKASHVLTALLDLGNFEPLAQGRKSSSKWWAKVFAHGHAGSQVSQDSWIQAVQCLIYWINLQTVSSSFHVQLLSHWDFFLVFLFPPIFVYSVSEHDLWAW